MRQDEAGWDDRAFWRVAVRLSVGRRVVNAARACFLCGCWWQGRAWLATALDGLPKPTGYWQIWTVSGGRRKLMDWMETWRLTSGRG